MLRDTQILEQASIVESNRSRLPEGVLLRVRGVAQRSGVKNENGRIYPHEVWEHVFSDENWKKSIKERAMVGEADHPESNVPSIKRASHVVSEAEWNGGEEIWATFDILDTPDGRILETLFKAGVKVGTSSRGDGATKRNDEQNADIVEVGYIPTTWDFVINPSTSGAYPTPVMEAVQSPDNQRARLTAIEGLVNSKPSKPVLLECYTKVNTLDAIDPSITEAKYKLLARIGEKLTENEQEDNMNGNSNAAASVAEGSQPALGNLIETQIKQAVAPLEEQNATLVRRLAEKDLKIKELEEALEESEKTHKTLEVKHNELVENVGGTDPEDIRVKYEAARTKVIPELLDKIDDLQEQLDAATELIETHTEEADGNRVAAYIESAIAKYPNDRKIALRSILEGSADVVEVDERLKGVESLIGQQHRPQTPSRPIREARRTQPTRPRGRRPGRAPDGRRLHEERQQLTPRELAERNQLPKPKTQGGDKIIGLEERRNTQRGDGLGNFVTGLSESMKK